MHKTKSQHAGFSLLEVMIALLILAVGILGAGSLQTVGLQTTQGAYMRSQAIILASDIVDRMRANPKALAAYLAAAPAVAPDTSCLTAAAGCSTAQIANLDLWNWQGSLNSVLPNGVGTVVSNGGGNNYTVQVTWSENEWVGGVRQSGQLKSVTLNIAITPPAS